MKKRIISFVTAVMLTVITAGAVSAQATLLVDNASLLSGSEYAYVEGLLENASDRHGASFVIVTVNGTGGKSMMEYADDYFDYNGYGEDGILLLIDNFEGDWYISTSGKYDNRVTNSGVLDAIEYDVLKHLENEDFCGAFEAFALGCDDTDRLYSEASEKEPFDIFVALLVSLGIGVLVAFIVTASMKSQLRNVKKETRAENYMVSGSLKVTESKDLFLYHHITRTPRPKSNSSGGSHRSSSGRSHGGRGGSFR